MSTDYGTNQKQPSSFMPSSDPLITPQNHGLDNDYTSPSYKEKNMSRSTSKLDMTSPKTLDQKKEQEANPFLPKGSEDPYLKNYYGTEGYQSPKEEPNNEYLPYTSDLYLTEAQKFEIKPTFEKGPSKTYQPYDQPIEKKPTYEYGQLSENNQKRNYQPASENPEFQYQINQQEKKEPGDYYRKPTQDANGLERRNEPKYSEKDIYGENRMPGEESRRNEKKPTHVFNDSENGFGINKISRDGSRKNSKKPSHVFNDSENGYMQKGTHGEESRNSSKKAPYVFNGREESRKSTELDKLKELRGRYEGNGEYEKEIRRQISELPPANVPEDERKIIQYLLGRLDEVENVLVQAQRVIGEDEEKRERLTEELDKKMAQLEELNQRESMSLERKVEEKMKKFLKASGKQIWEAKKERSEALARIGELDLKLRSLEGVNTNLKSSLETVNVNSGLKDSKSLSLNETIVELAESNKSLKVANLKANKQCSLLTEELRKLHKTHKEIRKTVAMATEDRSELEPYDALNIIKIILRTSEDIDIEALPQAPEINLNLKDFDEDQTLQSRQVSLKKVGRDSEYAEDYFSKITEMRKAKGRDRYNPENDVDDFLERNKDAIGSFLQPQKKKEASEPKKGSIGTQSMNLLQKSSLRPGEKPEENARLPNIHNRLYNVKKKENDPNNKNSYNEAIDIQTLLRQKKNEGPAKPNPRLGLSSKKY